MFKNLNKETMEHSLRVEALAVRLGIAMCLSLDQIQRIKTAARYHDIGKSQIPDEILNKPSKLTDEEFAIMKSHAILGCRLAKSRLDDEICNIILNHHENENGSGYNGLKAKEIPLGAKIIHVCDVYDALVSDRVYKKGWAKEDAIDFLSKQKRTMFDAKITDIFIAMILSEEKAKKIAG